MEILNGMIVRDKEEIIDCLKTKRSTLTISKRRANDPDYLPFESETDRSSEQ